MEPTFRVIVGENRPTTYAFGNDREALEYVPEYEGRLSMVVYHYRHDISPYRDQYSEEPPYCVVIGGKCYGEYSYLRADDIDPSSESTIEASLRWLYPSD